MALCPPIATGRRWHCFCFPATPSRVKVPEGIWDPGSHKVRWGVLFALLPPVGRGRPCHPGWYSDSWGLPRQKKWLQRPASQKMINDNKMLHRKRFRSQLILKNARFNRFHYSRASHVIACIVNLQEGLRDPLPHLYHPMRVLHGKRCMNHNSKATRGTLSSHT